MNTPLLIAERIPRGMTRLAREYYTFYDATRIKVARCWYRLCDNGRKAPQWLLVRLTDRIGHERSAVCMVCMYGDYCHDYYLSEYLSGLRENEEKVLSDWRRIAEEREQEE